MKRKQRINELLIINLKDFNIEIKIIQNYMLVITILMEKDETHIENILKKKMRKK